MSRPRAKMRISIGGSRWLISRARTPRDIYGDCDYATRKIRISHSLTGTDLLDTIIHETIHARWPDLSEAAVIEFAELLATVATAFGFTQEDDQ